MHLDNNIMNLVQPCNRKSLDKWLLRSSSYN